MIRPSWSRGFCVCALVALFGGATSADSRIGDSTTRQTGAANSRAYLDAVGDAKSGGLDIRKIVVSNDDTGRISFSVGVPSLDKLPAKKMIIIRLDVDRDLHTGSPQGFEYEIYLYWDYSGFLAQWRGSWRKIRGHGMTADGLTIEVDRSVLGNPSSFDFLVALSTWASTEDDRAPTPGLWRYKVIAPPARLALTGPRTIPSSPVAGQQYSAAFKVELVRTGSPREPIDGGEVECKATAAGKRLSVDYAGFHRGIATCAWPIPSSARGSVFEGTITIRSGGMTATKTFTGRVR